MSHSYVHEFSSSSFQSEHALFEADLREANELIKQLTTLPDQFEQEEEEELNEEDYKQQERVWSNNNIHHELHLPIHSFNEYDKNESNSSILPSSPIHPPSFHPINNNSSLFASSPTVTLPSATLTPTQAAATAIEIEIGIEQNPVEQKSSVQVDRVIMEEEEAQKKSAILYSSEFVIHPTNRSNAWYFMRHYSNFNQIVISESSFLLVAWISVAEYLQLDWHMLTVRFLNIKYHSMVAPKRFTRTANILKVHLTRVNNHQFKHLAQAFEFCVYLEDSVNNLKCTGIICLLDENPLDHAANSDIGMVKTASLYKYWTQLGYSYSNQFQSIQLIDANSLNGIVGGKSDHSVACIQARIHFGVMKRDEWKQSKSKLKQWKHDYRGMEALIYLLEGINQLIKYKHHQTAGLLRIRYIEEIIISGAELFKETANNIIPAKEITVEYDVKREVVQGQRSIMMKYAGLQLLTKQQFIQELKLAQKSIVAQHQTHKHNELELRELMKKHAIRQNKPALKSRRRASTLNFGTNPNNLSSLTSCSCPSTHSTCFCNYYFRIFMQSLGILFAIIHVIFGFALMYSIHQYYLTSNQSYLNSLQLNFWLLRSVGLLFIAFGGIFLRFVLFVFWKWFLVGSLGLGDYSVHSWLGYRIWLISLLWRSQQFGGMHDLFLGTRYWNWYLRLLGAEIGYNVWIYSMRNLTGFYPAFEHLSIGDNCYIGIHTQLQCSSYNHKTITKQQMISIRNIRIGSNCSFEERSIVYNGDCTIGNNFTMKCSSSLNAANYSVIANNSYCMGSKLFQGPIAVDHSQSELNYITSTDNSFLPEWFIYLFQLFTIFLNVILSAQPATLTYWQYSNNIDFSIRINSLLFYFLLPLFYVLWIYCRGIVVCSLVRLISSNISSIEISSRYSLRSINYLLSCWFKDNMLQYNEIVFIISSWSPLYTIFYMLLGVNMNYSQNKLPCYKHYNFISLSYLRGPAELIHLGNNTFFASNTVIGSHSVSVNDRGVYWNIPGHLIIEDGTFWGNAAILQLNNIIGRHSLIASTSALYCNINTQIKPKLNNIARKSNELELIEIDLVIDEGDISNHRNCIELSSSGSGAESSVVIGIPSAVIPEIAKELFATVDEQSAAKRTKQEQYNSILDTRFMRYMLLMITFVWGNLLIIFSVLIPGLIFLLVNDSTIWSTINVCLFLSLFYIAASVCLTFFTVCSKYCLSGVYHPSSHAYYSRTGFRERIQEFVWMNWCMFVGNFMLETELLSLVFKLLGVNIGVSVLLSDPFWNIFNFDLACIGDGAILEAGGSVQPHTFEFAVFQLDNLELADNTKLSAHSVLLPGIKFMENSILHPNSLVMRNSIVPPDSELRGVPARIIQHNTINKSI